MLRQIRLIIAIADLMAAAALCQARLTNPYPVAVLRQGDVFLLKGKGEWLQLTNFGDVKSLCWLAQDTICFEREMKTGLQDSSGWQGLQIIRDLFVASKDSQSVQQFTTDHFVREPSPSAIAGRALFAHNPGWFTSEYEIWETIRPNIRNRPLGIRGHLPDSAPNHRWTAAALNGEGPSGVGLYRYPTDDSYRKIVGPYTRPRFSPDSKWLAFLRVDNEADSCGIWVYEIPDGEAGLLVPLPEGCQSINDFGWTPSGPGFILALGHEETKSDLYFYDLDLKTLIKLSDSGDIERATSWH